MIRAALCPWLVARLRVSVHSTARSELFGASSPRHPPIVQAVLHYPSEGTAQSCHLHYHHSLSPASNPATSSSTRSTASRVPAGDDTAPEFNTRAIWLRFTPIRFNSRSSAAPSYNPLPHRTAICTCFPSARCRA